MTNTNEQNMPMWAYYANNHEGFCVEYELSEKQKNYIFPVLYEDKRLNGNWIITNLLSSFHKSIKDEKNGEFSSEFYFYLQVLFTTLAVKHTSWKHEKEYRSINILENYYSLYPSKIYIGLFCKDEYKKQLINIGRESNGKCKVFVMSNKKDSSNFELDAEEIIFE